MLRRLNLRGVLAAGLTSVRRCSTVAPEQTADSATSAAPEEKTSSADEVKKVNPQAAQLATLTESLSRTQHELNVIQLTRAITAARKLNAPRSTLTPVMKELTSRLDNGSGIRKLTGGESCEVLSVLAFSYSPTDAISNGLMSQILNNLNDCHPNQLVSVAISLLGRDEKSAKLLLESAMPMLAARCQKLSLWHASKTITLAVQLQIFDRLFFQSIEDVITSHLKKTPTGYLEVIQSFRMARYTPTTRFFEHWATLPGAETSFEGQSKEALTKTLKALGEMRKKPTSCYPLVDAVVHGLKPFVSSMYITEVKDLVVDLAEVGFINKNAPRSALGAQARNEQKIFAADCIIVAAADRVLQLKESVSIDIVKDLTFAFASMNAHYFRLWKFFADTVKAVVNDVDPPVLVSIVKHMARAKYCDDALWAKVASLVVSKMPLVPVQAVGQWSEALLVTVTSRRSKTTEFGDPTRSSVLEQWSAILDALTQRMIALFPSASTEQVVERQFQFSFMQLLRTIRVFYPNEDYALLKELNKAKEDYVQRIQDVIKTRKTSSSAAVVPSAGDSEKPCTAPLDLAPASAAIEVEEKKQAEVETNQASA